MAGGILANLNNLLQKHKIGIIDADSEVYVEKLEKDPGKEGRNYDH